MVCVLLALASVGLADVGAQPQAVDYDIDKCSVGAWGGEQR